MKNDNFIKNKKHEQYLPLQLGCLRVNESTVLVLLFIEFIGEAGS
jgi:hypothetical protein